MPERYIRVTSETLRDLEAYHSTQPVVSGGMDAQRGQLPLPLFEHNEAVSAEGSNQLRPIPFGDEPF